MLFMKLFTNLLSNSALAEDIVSKPSNFMPPAATKIAQEFNTLYTFLLIISFVSSVMVIGGMIYLAYKSRRKTEDQKTAYIAHNATLEFLWSFIPFVFFMIVFAWGWVIFHKMQNAPKDAFEVHVTGQKWYWDFTYKSGKTSSGEFVVPADTNIKLIMTSRDVLHSFFIPAFRIKQDVIPGRFTTLWFKAPKVGEYQIFCTEYCGDSHSAMLAKVKVLPKADFETWLQDNPYKGLSLAQVGQKIYQGRCIACHLTTDKKNIGPGFAGIIGQNREFENADSITVDEEYIRESILNPNAKIVKGYPQGVMPSFAGQLKENELSGIIEYIKTLKK